MSRSPRLSWLALLLAAVGAAYAAPPEAPPSIAALTVCQPVTADLLTKAFTAHDTIIYYAQGEIRDSANGGGPTTVRIYRNGRQDLTRREYYAPGQPDVIIIERGRERWQKQPDGSWLHENLLPQMLIGFAQRLDLLTANYAIEPAGERTIAGRQCWGYNILPKASGNPSRLMFIDAETYLPLRTENVNGLGDLVSVTNYSEVRYVDSLDADLFRAPSGNVEDDGIEREGPMSKVDAEAQTGFAVREPDYVPDGYRFAGALTLRQGRSVAVHMQWFDGLSIISLFKQRSGGTLPSGSGWTRHHANSVSWTSDGFSYQLMGDIIPAELSRMRDSVR